MKEQTKTTDTPIDGYLAVIRRFSAQFKTRIYELWHGHPFLLKEEADIICETRFDPKFKHFNDREIQQLVKLRIENMYDKVKEQQKCMHEKWDCDSQIRVIQCQKCGKRAWIENYRSLY